MILALGSLTVMTAPVLATEIVLIALATEIVLTGLVLATAIVSTAPDLVTAKLLSPEAWIASPLMYARMDV
jgi:hypothetical protein